MYDTFFEMLIVVIICVSIVRMVTQGLFFYAKFNKTFKDGIIPIASVWKLHKTFGVQTFYLLGTISRVLGLLFWVIALAWQSYDQLLQMTHMYGIMFHTYTPVDYSIGWTIFSFAGLVLGVSGVIMRWFPTVRISQYFGMHGFINVVGTIEPTLYYLWLTASPKAVFLLNKPTKQMSSEEYQMYCFLTEE